MDNFFPKRIIAARKAAKLKQTEVAVLLGVPPVTINRWEKGKRTPSADTINQLAKIYGCDITSLIEGETGESEYKTVGGEKESLADQAGVYGEKEDQTGKGKEQILLAAFRRLDAERQDRLIAIAEDMPKVNAAYRERVTVMHGTVSGPLIDKRYEEAMENLSFHGTEGFRSLAQGEPIPKGQKEHKSKQ